MRAGSADFNAQLAAGGWDAVAVDCPSSIPTTGGGWTPLINYVNGGGRVAMAFWDWDNPGGFGAPGLIQAFGATATLGEISTSGQTLSDSGTTPIFAGVTMPRSGFASFWSDDGDRFSLAPGSIGAATLSGSSDPVMFVGNSGRTVASLVLDEWGSPEGAIVWRNMLNYVVPEPASFALFSLALLGLRRR